MNRVGATIRLRAASDWSPLWPALLLAGAAITAIGITRFDGLYGQDSFAYFGYAGSLRDSILHPHLPPAFFWPPGYPLTVAAIAFVAGASPIAGQIASGAAGAAVACLTALLAREALLSARGERQQN